MKYYEMSRGFSWLSEFTENPEKEQFFKGIAETLAIHPEWADDWDSKKDAKDLRFSKRLFHTVFTCADRFWENNRETIMDSSVGKFGSPSGRRAFAGQDYIRDFAHILNSYDERYAEDSKKGTDGFRSGRWLYDGTEVSKELKGTYFGEILSRVDLHKQKVRRERHSSQSLLHPEQLPGEDLYHMVLLSIPKDSLDVGVNPFGRRFMLYDPRIHGMDINTTKQTFLEAVMFSNLDDNQKRKMISYMDEGNMEYNLRLSKPENISKLKAGLKSLRKAA